MLTRKFSLLHFILLLLVLSCSTESPLTPALKDHSVIATSIKLEQKGYAASALDSLILVVTGDGIDRIKQALIIEGTKAQAHLQVPTDVKLKMEVTGYQDTTAVLYGSKEFIGKKDSTAQVQIKLDFLVPTLILSPPDTVLQIGDRIHLHLAARNVDNMSTFGAEVHFDPTKLQVVELDREDTFLRSNHGSIMQLEFTKDNSAGTVKAVLGIFPASSAVSGSGNIGVIVFEAIAPDTTDISIRIDNQSHSDLGLFDKHANLMYSVGLGSRLFIQQSAAH
ncbi:hypothetical protein JXA02_09565 [candidate division KSB1 bacterium]|nr:hypothetical protein [candidate division KSB1 bacterium]RQW04315.1 MAG: hypothetical protein EH222_11345 [candidate division KSB1 bacterium]